MTLAGSEQYRPKLVAPGHGVDFSGDLTCGTTRWESQESSQRLSRIAALLLLLSAGAAAQRLPQDARPEHYQLAISADIKAKTFTGEETIALRLAKPSSQIVLNSLDLEITSAEIRNQTAQVTYDHAAEIARLTFPKPVKAGAASLYLKFKATLGDHLRGFYLSKTARRSYAVTQFEGTYARMMFPCFDEPSFKATFDITVELDKDDTAISNGRIMEDKPAGAGRHTLKFSTSPRMSTYLVALAIGDWQCLSAPSGKERDAVEIRVCAVPEKKEQVRFALEVAQHSVEFYNKWFGIRYPFEKLDLLAIPDYEWGGMENAGSIFFRDSALLQDEATASVSGRRGRATVVAHEIAHQWFGDYVTAAWWDDIWLNEGFATWMETKPVAAWHPEWQLEDDETSSAQGVISTDSLGATRAIHGNPKTPDDIKEMFDGITYEKGAAVLSMLEAYVGPGAFRRASADYLRAHANGNATSADFWQAVTRTSGKPVDKIMPTFVMQPGVPMLSLNASCVSNETRIDVEQKQFFLSPTAAKDSTALWQIPLCIKGGACTLVTARRQSFSQRGCSEGTYGNRDAKGYYRVSYSPENLRALAATAESNLNPPERIALIEDTWAMARAGKATIGRFLDLAQALKAETDRTSVSLLAAHLRYLGDSLVSQDQRPAYLDFLRKQFRPLAVQLGWEPRSSDTEEQKGLRANLLGILGDAGDPAAVSAALQLTGRRLTAASSVDGTLARAALSVAARNGDAKLYDGFTSAYVGAKDADESELYLYLLADFRDPELLRRTVALIDSGQVREQEYPHLFSALLGNPASRDAAWTYLKTHWDTLSVQITSFGGAGAVAALGDFCSAVERDDVTRFFETHQVPGAERALRLSVDRMNNCIEFRDLQQANMRAWLNQ
jgi:aminopeptidase N/puromycin-sensitive aminopeptidase